MTQVQRKLQKHTLIFLREQNINPDLNKTVFFKKKGGGFLE